MLPLSAALAGLLLLFTLGSPGGATASGVVFVVAVVFSGLLSPGSPRPGHILGGPNRA